MAKVMEPTVNANEVSRIPSGTEFKGEISSQNDIRIDGTFEGKIISEGRVVVGENATIKGDVISAFVDIWGKMEGDLYVKDTLSLKATSKVNGNLHIKRIQMELNAIFEGTCQMISEDEVTKLWASVNKINAPTRPGVPPVQNNK